MPVDRRVIDQALLGGVDRLGLGELVALVCGLSVAEGVQLLTEAGSLRRLGRERLLGGWTEGGLALSDERRAALLGALELGQRACEERALQGRPMGTVADVAAWGIDRLGELDHEEVWVLGLSADGRLAVRQQVARGGAWTAAFLVHELMGVVLRMGVLRFVLLHNHPEGDPTPSDEDLEVTRQIDEAARALGLAFLDHVVVGRHRYRSIRKLEEKKARALEKARRDKRKAFAKKRGKKLRWKKVSS